MILLLLVFHHIVATRIPTEVCHDLAECFQCVFQEDISVRYTAKDCLKFFKKYTILRKYPEIHIVAQHKLENAFENQKYAEVCESIVEHFDAICSNRLVKSLNEVSSLLLFLFY